MSQKSSCIQHPAKASLVILRDEYLQICDGNHCAAMLLSVFEYWHNVKLAGAEQAEIDAAIAAKTGIAPDQSADVWVYKTQANLKSDLLGLFGETKVLSATKLLIESGFLITRNNPKYQWDHTTQYQLCPAIVQEAIAQNYGAPLRKSKQSIAQKYAIDPRKSKQTIPETTTETTPEIKEKEVPLVATVPAPPKPSTPEQMAVLAKQLFDQALNGKTPPNIQYRASDEEHAATVQKMLEKYGAKNS